MAGSTASAAQVQARVIGALILRELHTRFGRQNIGYLWLFAEPMLLAVAVAVLHAQHDVPLAGNVRTVPFAIAGYTLFIMFRSTVSRGETLLEANLPLLNHRRVTILDMLAARALLELASTTLVLAVLLSAAALLGLAEWPSDILLVIAATGLVGWFSFACSMLVAFFSHESAIFSRLIHPLLYLSLPLSGAFYSMLWLPPSFRELLAWVPTVPMFELLKVGQFDGYPTEYAGLAYPALVCAVLTVLGLLSVRILRGRVKV